MGKKTIAFFCAVLLTCALALPGAALAAGAGFGDVPSGDWAAAYIDKTVSLGIMEGYGGGVFGYGDNVTRAQFAAMLTRLFGWTLQRPDTPTFSDAADPNAWYYGAVETAVQNGAVQSGGLFRPDDAITREEMAVMLVRALGYDRLAQSVSTADMPFTDVTSNRAYIAMAWEFGIINGTTATAFSPAAPATREQAAAMMIRLYDAYYAKTDWFHGFYAISSYAQKDVIPSLDAVSFGWSQLEVDENGAPVLNTTPSGGNSFYTPQGGSEVTALAKENGVAANLCVFMSTYQTVTKPDGTGSNPCREILLDADRRQKAVAAITAELKRANAYSGVTIDFEGMSGAALREGFTLFLQTLREALPDQPLYVCVHPVTADGGYYDAYDYRAIGQIADKVILMAHDYAAQTLTQAEMDACFTETPQTPIYYIYDALRAVTDDKTGVEDKSKIALALSFGSTEWMIRDGKIVNAIAYSPYPSTVFPHLSDASAITGYSQLYENPYLKYHSDGDNADYMIWYEDTRSAAAKVALAHLFGVDGVSVWRLGLIPDFPDPEGRTLHYDVLSWLLAQK